MVRLKRSAMLWAIAVLVALLAGGCGGKSAKKAGGTTAGAKGGTLVTRANAAPSGSPDPQVNYTLQEWQFLIITHDGLVAFKRVGGPEGTNNWQVIGISRDQWRLVGAALALGGNVRAGLEDNFYLPNGEMARSNGDLIAKARQMVEDVGRRPATVAEARAMLGVPRRAAA